MQASRLMKNLAPRVECPLCGRGSIIGAAQCDDASLIKCISHENPLQNELDSPLSVCRMRPKPANVMCFSNQLAKLRAFLLDAGEALQFVTASDSVVVSISTRTLRGSCMT